MSVHHWGAERTFKSEQAFLRALPDVSDNGIITSVYISHIEGIDHADLYNFAKSYRGKSESVWNRLPMVVMKPERPPMESMDKGGLGITPNKKTLETYSTKTGVLESYSAGYIRKHPPTRPPSEEGTSRRLHFLESQGCPPNCAAIQYSDMVQCPCGLAWDTNDPKPPLCPRNQEIAAKALGIAAQSRSPEELRQALQRLSPLYSTLPAPGWGRLIDRGGHIFLGIILGAVSLYLAWSLI